MSFCDAVYRRLSQSIGLLARRNKVKSQVDIPRWIFSRTDFMKAFLRGFFDTDGSFYALKFGTQISFTNHSLPMLSSLQRTLHELEYKPSKISGWHLYLTRRKDIHRFFTEIKPANLKHKERFRRITKMRR